MRYPIVRMYETETQARGAVSKLREERFADDSVFLVTPGSGPDAVAAALKAGQVLREDAKAYSDAIHQGRSIVLVFAPFGFGQEATAILDSFGPIETDVGRPAVAEASVAWDEAAPMSSALKMAPLMRGAPAPFSSLVGFHTLSTGLTFETTDALISSDWTFSSLYGMSLLSSNPAPLSSALGMKTVSVSTGPTKSTFGTPLLSSNAAPFSSAIGINLLVGPLKASEPAPFSAHLGIPTLTGGGKTPRFGKLLSSTFALFGRNPLMRNPAPLSSMLGLGTLSHQGGSSWTASFGLPLLTSGGKPSMSPSMLRHPAPFSALFGMPVLSRYQ